MFAQFEGQINHLLSANWLLQFAQLHYLIFPKFIRKDHLKDAVSSFTYGSSNGRLHMFRKINNLDSMGISKHMQYRHTSRQTNNNFLKLIQKEDGTSD